MFMSFLVPQIYHQPYQRKAGIAPFLVNLCSVLSPLKKIKKVIGGFWPFWEEHLHLCSTYPGITCSKQVKLTKRLRAIIVCTEVRKT